MGGLRAVVKSNAMVRGNSKRKLLVREAGNNKNNKNNSNNKRKKVKFL